MSREAYQIPTSQGNAPGAGGAGGMARSTFDLEGVHDKLHLRRLRLQVRPPEERHHPLQGMWLPHPVQGADEKVRLSRHIV
ncbi:hypothetical protein RRF57_010220 [Xylaria bambusicola]|uniref:Uncharacterized protein n=1 Tax=Xylaria bambusicola TaxID=326684 RepID=A0AAN7Z9E7_9PEZI